MRCNGQWVRGALLAALLVTEVAVFSGCNLTPSNNGGGNQAAYNLVVVLERNLELNQDIVYLRFRHENHGITGGVVIVDGDTISTLPASGQGTKTYSPGRWTQQQMLQIKALDASNSYAYRDSIKLPSSFEITNVIPPNRLWQGGNVTLTWTPALDADAYFVSVKPRTIGSPARGLGSYDTDSDPLSETFPGAEAFSNTFGTVIPDVYDMQIVAYSRNFTLRPNAPYKAPDADDVRVPISRTDIDGAVCALMVSARDTIRVPQTQ
jgi:hypothetical protein